MMIPKKFFLLLALITLLQSSLMIAQEYVPTEDEIKQFFKTKTLVVLQDNPMSSYNFEIKDIIKKEWNLTEYEFIDATEFDEKRLDPQYSFLIMTQVNFARDKTRADYRFLHLMLGGNYFRVNQMPDIVSVPVSYSGVGEDSYVYKISALVRWMQNHVQLIHKNPDLIGNNMFQYYRDNVSDIQDKTLYVIREELAPEVNSEKKIKAVYPYPFKIVSKEDVQRAIEERDSDVAFLHKVGPEGSMLNARTYKVVLGAGETTLYYFDYHKIDKKKRPDGFLEVDFKKLATGKRIILF
jgi:hypothetical protein